MAQKKGANAFPAVIILRQLQLALRVANVFRLTVEGLGLNTRS